MQKTWIRSHQPQFRLEGGGAHGAHSLLRSYWQLIAAGVGKFWSEMKVLEGCECFCVQPYSHAHRVVLSGLSGFLKENREDMKWGGRKIGGNRGEMERNGMGIDFNKTHYVHAWTSQIKKKKTSTTGRNKGIMKG